MSDQRTCTNCGKLRPIHELSCETVAGIDRYRCNSDIDKDCQNSQARTYEWYEGWRRERGLSPHDGQRGPEAAHVYETDRGIESWYPLCDDIYLVIIETYDGDIILSDGQRKIF